MIIDEILKLFEETNAQQFITIIEKAIKIMHQERKDQTIREFKIVEDLIIADSIDLNYLIIGDIHGDIETLVNILKLENVEEEIRKGHLITIFLGDYGDRGEHSPDVYYLLLNLKLEFPDGFIMLRGNHEGTDDLLAYPHDLPLFLIEKFGQEGFQVYKKIKSLFDTLYLSFVVKGKFIALHGGIPVEASNLDDIAYARKLHPKRKFFEEILWNDPMDENGFERSYRGAGMLFGPDISYKFLHRNNLKCLIRGHEAVRQGYYITHAGRVVTIFSRKGPPYFNEKAAYLKININELENLEHIKNFIRTL